MFHALRRDHLSSTVVIHSVLALYHQPVKEDIPSAVWLHVLGLGTKKRMCNTLRIRYRSTLLLLVCVCVFMCVCVCVCV